MLTNPRDAFNGHSRSPIIVPFHMLCIVSSCAIATLSLRRAVFPIFDLSNCSDFWFHVKWCYDYINKLLCWIVLITCCGTRRYHGASTRCPWESSSAEVTWWYLIILSRLRRSRRRLRCDAVSESVAHIAATVLHSPADYPADEVIWWYLIIWCSFRCRLFLLISIPFPTSFSIIRTSSCSTTT